MGNENNCEEESVFKRMSDAIDETRDNYLKSSSLKGVSTKEVWVIYESLRLELLMRGEKTVPVCSMMSRPEMRFGTVTKDDSDE